MERSVRKGLFCRQRQSYPGNDPPFVRLLLASPRGHAKQRREFDGYSRLDDSDVNTYWKSNPYLTKAFTGEEDSTHPQWIAIKLAERQIGPSGKILPVALLRVVDSIAGA